MREMHVEVHEMGNSLLSRRGGMPQNHTHVIQGGREECITTSRGRNGRGAENTIPRSSSPRREAHRGRRRGSVLTAPFASSASTTPFVETNGMGCGVA